MLSGLASQCVYYLQRGIEERHQACMPRWSSQIERSREEGGFHLLPVKCILSFLSPGYTGRVHVPQVRNTWAMEAAQLRLALSQVCQYPQDKRSSTYSPGLASGPALSDSSQVWYGGTRL